MESSLIIVPQHKVLSKLEKIILYFFMYSFIGWALETLYAFYELGTFVKRGFLFGPICPIYGTGAIILLLLLDKYKKNNIILFFVSGIVFTVFEYIVSFGLAALFKISLWDYTNEFLNLNGRISIFFSLVWGLFAIFFINHIHPFIKKHTFKILKKIPYMLQITLLKTVILIFFIDIIFSCIRYLTIM